MSPSGNLCAPLWTWAGEPAPFWLRFFERSRRCGARSSMFRQRSPGRRRYSEMRASPNTSRPSDKSFFDPLPAGADLYLLKSVLADCGPIGGHSDPAAMRRSRLSDWPRRHRDGVLAESKKIPAPALLMMVLVGGKERSLAE